MGASIKLSQKDFSHQIETFVKETNSTYVDATLHMCDIHGLEPDSVAKLITKPIREKLEVEGQQINLVPKSPALPL